MNPGDFVDTVGGINTAKDFLDPLEPHITLVAHPATLEPKLDKRASHDSQCLVSVGELLATLEEGLQFTEHVSDWTLSELDDD